ncbi:xylose isomerase [Pasteurellaceae bacterium Pebbles2]|nr:xylose isomerase [Pasteurellaceae bacterium Pebbles2]
MNISISNIAWNTDQDNDIQAMLKDFGFSFIDIAPAKYFPNPLQATEKEIKAVRDFWLNKDVNIIGMQSLLFGTKGFNLFAETNVQNEMLDYLEAICRLASYLGISKLVFGSPKNRDCTGLTKKETEKTAVLFFRNLGDKALKYGVDICLEPNPTCYGANFMTSSMETLNIVKLVNHPAIKMQLDTGATLINQENIADVLVNSYPYIGHIHLSEPNLDILGVSGQEHLILAKEIKHYFPQSVATIEMLTKSENNLADIYTALQFAKEYYQ